MTAPPAQGRPIRFDALDLALLGVASVVWGAAYIFIRQGIELGAAPLPYAAARYGLSALAFAGLAIATREQLPARAQFTVSAVVGGVLIVGLYGGFLYWGEQYTTGGYAAVLASTVPLLTTAIGFSLLSTERLGGWGLSGMAVGFVGAVVLVLPELWGSPLGGWQGPLFVLAAMVSTTLGSVLLRRLGRGRQGLWQIGTQFAVAGALLGAVSLVVPGGTALPWTAGLVEALAFLVLLSSVVGYFAYFALHHRVGPIRANVVAYLVPLVGVAIGSSLFGEAFTSWEIAGVAIVLAGVSLVLWESSRRPAPGPVG